MKICEDKAGVIVPTITDEKHNTSQKDVTMDLPTRQLKK